MKEKGVEKDPIIEFQERLRGAFKGSDLEAQVVDEIIKLLSGWRNTRSGSEPASDGVEPGV